MLTENLEVMTKKILLLLLTTYLTALASPSFAQNETELRYKTDTVSTHTPSSMNADEKENCACSCGDCCGSCFFMEAARQSRKTCESAQNPPAEELTFDKDSKERKSLSDTYHLALRANLLRWATLTADLGIEWRINGSVGIVADGTYASWAWKHDSRRYALWEVNPEVRWYLGRKKNCYVGAMFKAGAFNFRFSDAGKQGDLLGGGITGGYMLELCDSLALDFSLGVGYVRAGCDSYSVIDGIRFRDGESTKNWWGPAKVGVTLVWKIF